MPITAEQPRVDPGSTGTAGKLTCGPGTGSGAWSIRECPSCGRSYDVELDVCIDDGVALRTVGFSLPFIWIG